MKEKKPKKTKEKKVREKKERKPFKPENPIGFMRGIIIASVLLGIMGLFLCIRYAMNSGFLIAYNKGNYSSTIPNALQKVNIPEGYLPYYNAGNVDYMHGDYDSAIGNYKQALECAPPEKKECSIRINLALAMCHKIDFENLDTEKSVASAVRQLKAARKVLVEDGCACPEVGKADGHSPEAEKLKKDIDDMLQQLDSENQYGDEDEEEQEDSGDEDKKDSSSEHHESQREQQLREDLEEQKEESMEHRQEVQESEYNQSGENGGYGENQDQANW